MSDKKREKIVLLGTADYLKKSLMSLILRKDAHGDHDYNDKYEITCKIYKASDDKQNPDMCLLVVEDGFSPTKVQQRIEDLHKTTKISIDKFKVVLPLGENSENYSPTFYTLGQLFTHLAENKNHKSTNKRSADGPPSQMETENSQPSRSWNPLSWFSNDNKKSVKGNHSDTKVNLVLLGMSGTGKSATGNTILGERRFKSEASSMPITTECRAEETDINGTCVRVIDTPDMFDDEINPSVKKQHVAQCRRLIIESDPCVYLLVIQVGRFTDGERDILRKFEEAFGHEVKEQKNKIIILFTCGEDLQRKKMSLQVFLQKCQPALSKIVEQCDRRCVVFENNASGQPQVTKLMQTVNRMLDKQQKQ